MKVLCIGSSLLEITCQINEPVRENTVMHFDGTEQCGAGHAGNVAYLLGKWGVETYIASMMGADDFASKIKKEFEAIGVKTDLIETSYDKPTSQTVVLVNTTTKNDTIIEIMSNAHLKKYAYNTEPDIIVADGYEFNATVTACDKYPKAKSFLMVRNTNNEVLELCKYVNYLVFNKETSESYAGIKIDYNNSSTVVNVYNKLKQKFNKAEIVITLGERGSVYSINGQVKIMPPVKVNLVDPNGAGDIYMGGFVYAMGRNFGLEKAICYGTIAASLSTTKLTSRMSIPSINEVSTYYDSKFGPQNNPQHLVEGQANPNPSSNPVVNEASANNTVQQAQAGNPSPSMPEPSNGALNMSMNENPQADGVNGNVNV